MPPRAFPQAFRTSAASSPKPPSSASKTAAGAACPLKIFPRAMAAATRTLVAFAVPVKVATRASAAAGEPIVPSAPSAARRMSSGLSDCTTPIRAPSAAA